MIDHMDIGTFADTHRTAMRPHGNRQRLERGEYAHQLLLATDLVYAGTPLLIDGARQAARLCRSGQGKQTMAEPVFCRETNERISCLALGRENAERFSQSRDAAIGKRRDIDTRNGVRCELPRKRDRVWLFPPPPPGHKDNKTTHAVQRPTQPPPNA